MARRNQAQAIFTPDFDRRRGAASYSKKSRHNLRLYAYVLMGNRVHHLIQIAKRRSPR
jgi:hypothetical protein